MAVTARFGALACGSWTMNMNRREMSTLRFQPEAGRYYEEGYWRAGDLWMEFAACAPAHPEKIAFHAGDVHISYGELERAAIALSDRLDGHGIEPGDVVLALGRHSVEAA